MSFDIDKLYALLPAFHRQRDYEQGGPALALLTVVAEQIAVLEENLDQLYDDQFIETCAQWVIPYIGELVGTRGLVSISSTVFSQRAEVANTIHYRRRKGTALLLQLLARDVTGWDATVVEYFLLLATTQYMNHLRPDNIAVADLRDWKKLLYLGTAFDKTARTADVRSIARRRGRYNIPNVGIFLFRINSYPHTQSPAYPLDPYRYTFDALGRDLPLYNLPLPEGSLTKAATPEYVPLPLPRRILHDCPATYYGVGQSLLVYVNGVAQPASQICVCDLSDVKGGAGWTHMPTNKIAVDPVLGRLAFPGSQAAPAKVQVTYQYGFSTEMGGGEYGRSTSFTSGLTPVIEVPSAAAATIQQALDALAFSGGVVEIQNNDYYFETPVIRLAASTQIELRAADQCRPVLVLSGELTIVGGANSQLTINGLLISGGYLHVPLADSSGETNLLGTLQIVHCCLLPGASPALGTVPAQPALPRLVVEAANTQVQLSESISGGIRAADVSTLSISNSIIDAGDKTAVALADLTGQGPGAALTAVNTTIIGKVYTMLMTLASDTLFLAGLRADDDWSEPVLVERLQQGCTRFSYFPAGCQLPRPFQCQPQLTAGVKIVVPVFTSLRYGDAGYCQLSVFCPREIREGADDGAEMGAFHDLYQPQRIASLKARLEEYLRFSLEAGVFPES